MAIGNITEFIEIEKFTNYQLGKWHCGKRMISGSFKEEGSDDIITGDKFECLNINNDPMESYKCAIAYFNYTIQREGEKRRVAHEAVWVLEEEE